MSEAESKTEFAGIPPASAPIAPPPDEFGHIPSRASRPPLLALAAAALAVFLAVRLRHDVTFALSSPVPIEAGDARVLAPKADGDLPLNRYVRLTGLPERESAVVLDTRGSWQFTQFFRLRGTGGRVFVRRAEDPLPLALAEHDVFTGRLLRLGDLSFADSIAQHFGSRVTATHFFRPADLVTALTAARPLALSDLAGDRVTLAETERLAIDVRRPGQYQIELPRARFADVAAARKAVEGTGAAVIEARDTPARWVLIASVSDDRRDQVLSAIGELDHRAALRPARDTVEAAVSDLSVKGDNLVAGTQTIPLARLVSVRTRGPVHIPDNALLLIEGEAPRENVKSVVALAFLLGFAVVNLLSLRRAR